jgi:hypothetical protein
MPQSHGRVRESFGWALVTPIGALDYTEAKLATILTNEPSPQIGEVSIAAAVFSRLLEPRRSEEMARYSSLCIRSMNAATSRR